MASLTWAEPQRKNDKAYRAVRVACDPPSFPGDKPRVILNLMRSPDSYHGLASIGQANLTPDAARALAHNLETAADVAEQRDDRALLAHLQRWMRSTDPEAAADAEKLAAAVREALR